MYVFIYLLTYILCTIAKLILVVRNYLILETTFHLILADH